jgi:hypothetical protein
MTRLSWAGCLLMILTPTSAVRAELTCTETPFEAGQVASGTVIRHAFTLVNRGKSAIDVTEVKPGCGCMRPNLDRVTLAPSQQSTLTLEINTLTQPAGPNLWRTVVHYQEKGANAELIVYVRANLQAVVSVSPASLIIHTQNGAKGEFVFSEHYDQPLSIRGVAVASPHVRASCGAPVREAGVWKRNIFIEVLPSMPEGRHDDVVRLMTGDAWSADLSVPFTVIKRAPGRVDATPATLDVLAQGDAPLASRIVLLGSGDSKPVVIDHVEVGSPFMHCTWAQGPGERATMRVQFDREMMPAEKSFDTSIRVHVREPMPQVVTIPVHCSRP